MRDAPDKDTDAHISEESGAVFVTCQLRARVDDTGLIPRSSKIEIWQIDVRERSIHYDVRYAVSLPLLRPSSTSDMKWRLDERVGKAQ